MSDEKESRNAEEMAGEIIESVTSDNETEDSLTQRERRIEKDKEAERIRKARELKKQLRKRDLGLLKYRWPAVILLLSGIMSIITEFLQVMEAPEGYGFSTFIQVAIERLAQGQINYVVFYTLPLIAGTIMIIGALISYYNPRGTFLSIIPAMMMVMAGANIYYFIDITYIINPEIVITATGVPFAMILFGVVALLSIGIREKE
jgi:hypothetical protein